jgi:hypothetical protein
MEARRPELFQALNALYERQPAPGAAGPVDRGSAGEPAGAVEHAIHAEPLK